ncbi:hypothetical protein SAMN02910289_01189 [Lachnospiraceae bacterium RM5]|nr:hypothetical protein SAMN02910289_01189 [Lachnospiraceae bacterium RM5]
MINENKLKQDIKMIEDSIKKVSHELEMLRSDETQSLRLRAIKHGNHYQYFQREKGSETNGKYIRKEEITRAIALAQIEYDERLLSSLQESKEVLEKCKSTGIASSFDSVLAGMTKGKRKLVKPHFISDEEYIKTWKAQKYEGLPFKENSPEYYTKRGLRVRSKSEILIADMLDEMSIPFFYEKPLQLKRRIVHPDFTLLDIKERKEVYWEHFGMMDDREYRDEVLLKIREYEASGLYQFDSVIWTFESTKCIMNTRDIRNMVNELSRILGY